MKKTFRTCTEHAHCQEEIQETEWDDKLNTHVVVHHRTADEQPDSPVAPERFLRFNEAEEWVKRLGDLAGQINKESAALTEIMARLEQTASDRKDSLDVRAAALDQRDNETQSSFNGLSERLVGVEDSLTAVKGSLAYLSLSRRGRRKVRKAAK